MAGWPRNADVVVAAAEVRAAVDLARGRGRAVVCSVPGVRGRVGDGQRAAVRQVPHAAVVRVPDAGRVLLVRGGRIAVIHVDRRVGRPRERGNVHPGDERAGGGVERLDLVAELRRPVGGREHDVVAVRLRVRSQVGVRGEVDQHREVALRRRHLRVVDRDRLPVAPGARVPGRRVDHERKRQARVVEVEQQRPRGAVRLKAPGQVGGRDIGAVGRLDLWRQQRQAGDAAGVGEGDRTVLERPGGEAGRVERPLPGVLTLVLFDGQELLGRPVADRDRFAAEVGLAEGAVVARLPGVAGDVLGLERGPCHRCRRCSRRTSRSGLEASSRACG